ncbi:thiol peroxidase [Flocculibacter collagenilyticus]|uniref:thiol peroxidase n=1 Tax=Flocculibacter collagenilyticus TaxID=2744479 RepID=UPI001F24B0D5|nr:thiol peroxidase [Flocculibacter collagenilyticus]
MMKILRKTLFLTTVLGITFISFLSVADCKDIDETKGLVKAGNKHVILQGEQINEGDKAPNFKVVDGTFTPVELSSFKGKTILLSVVPSLDTGVCSLQTKRFNEEVANFPNDVVMLTISADLPFAQKRFCQNEKVDKIQVLSDSVWHDFGAKYGLMIKDMGLLARSILIINKEGNVAYKEVVAQLSHHPDYVTALKALQKIEK